eukprot:Rhum_TRINITY_DN17457_c0_g1::Rhum_TRINITY_DN17457_c0_g1_i1::g.166012::m.166012
MRHVMPEATPFTPVVIHGRHHDCCAAVEAVAQRTGAKLTPFLLTHEAAAATALKALVKNGFQRGQWLHIVATSATLDVVPVLRQLGVTLLTNANRGTGMVHAKMRVFVSTRDTSSLHYPSVLLMNAKLVNIDTLASAREQDEASLVPKPPAGAPGAQARTGRAVPAARTGEGGKPADSQKTKIEE